MVLSKDAILGASDLPTKDVEVPEWGGTVRLQALTGTQRDEFEASTVQQSGSSRKMNLKNIRARLVALCLVDDDGNRLFSESEVKSLGSKSARALDRLFNEAQKLSGLSKDDVEGLAENFGSDQSGLSTSA